MNSEKKTSVQPRVELNEPIIRKFLKRISDGKVSELAHDMGLPYELIYNLVHGRINSISTENYKVIFGEDPPYQESKRVDGAYFRRMVGLWLYFNDEVTEADLYRELFRGKEIKKVDYRIFRGFTKTVEKRLQSFMEQKFINQGFSRAEIKKMAKELDLIDDPKRVDYKRIKPVLYYLASKLNVNPTRVLNQEFSRYERGELNTVSKTIYDRALELKKRTQNALNSGSKYKIEKIREEIYGKRKGLTLFSEIEEELAFLKKHAKESPRRYLGRSISNYKKLNLKRIASWRSRKIKAACSEFVNNNSELALASLPNYYAKMKLKPLLSVLKSHLIARLIKDGGGIEKLTLAPAYSGKKKYQTGKYGFISMNKAATFLEMSKRAFDLMVVEHCDIFRKIATYNQQWYLPFLYLKHLKEKKEFDLVKAKYEMLAQEYSKTDCSADTTGRHIQLSSKKSSQQPEESEQACIMEASQQSMLCLESKTLEYHLL